MDWLPGGLQANPYFSAGFGLTLMGVGLAMARRSAALLQVAARKRFTVTLEVTSKDQSYPWVLAWLHTQSARSLSTMQQHVSVETFSRKLDNGGLQTSFDFVPSPGQHFVTYGRSLIYVERTREKQMVDLSSGTPWETLRLTTFGRDPAFFTRLLEEARQLGVRKEDGKTVIYTSWGTEWRPFGRPRRRRPLNSVILDDGVAREIVTDVQKFLNSAEWYTERGIPYRRGYLLHGSPGSGKTSFIMALAGEINYNICIVNLNERGLTDDRLAHSLSVLPLGSLVLLEDVDAAFRQRAASDTSSGSHLTFSGLLNVLDGAVAGEERLVFMTTNHLSRLDPALVRPGRVDAMYHVGAATPHQIAQLFLRFFAHPEAADDARAFATATADHGLSMAALQGYFMLHRGSLAAVQANIPALLAMHGTTPAKGD